MSREKQIEKAVARDLREFDRLIQDVKGFKQELSQVAAVLKGMEKQLKRLARAESEIGAQSYPDLVAVPGEGPGVSDRVKSAISALSKADRELASYVKPSHRQSFQEELWNRF